MVGQGRTFIVERPELRRFEAQFDVAHQVRMGAAHDVVSDQKEVFAGVHGYSHSRFPPGAVVGGHVFCAGLFVARNFFGV